MAFNTPADLHYASTHEWLRVEDGHAVIGITDYAQDTLGDVVYVELPAVGANYDAGATFGAVESVKAASDLYMPAAGEVIAVNEAVVSAPELLNSDPYGEGWLLKIKLNAPPSDLLDASAYEQHVDSIAH